MLIHCPYCGPRDLIEFAVRGEARVRHAPQGDLDGVATRADFAESVYFRDNPAGPHREHWLHAAGCQSWLAIERDTRTHQILKVEAVAAAAPEGGS
jgi:sarcosine oxidase subunit delta